MMGIMGCVPRKERKPQKDTDTTTNNVADDSPQLQDSPELRIRVMYTSEKHLKLLNELTEIPDTTFIDVPKGKDLYSKRNSGIVQ